MSWICEGNTEGTWWCVWVHIWGLSGFVWRSTANCWQMRVGAVYSQHYRTMRHYRFYYEKYISFLMPRGKVTWTFFSWYILTVCANRIVCVSIHKIERWREHVTMKNSAKARVCHDAAEAKGILTLVSIVAWMEHHSTIYALQDVYFMLVHFNYCKDYTFIILTESTIHQEVSILWQSFKFSKDCFY